MTWAKLVTVLLSVVDKFMSLYHDTQLRRDGAREQREADNAANEELKQRQDEAAANAADDFDTAINELRGGHTDKRD